MVAPLRLIAFLAILILQRHTADKDYPAHLEQQGDDSDNRYEKEPYAIFSLLEFRINMFFFFCFFCCAQNWQRLLCL